MCVRKGFMSIAHRGDKFENIFATCEYLMFERPDPKLSRLSLLKEVRSKVFSFGDTGLINDCLF